MQDPWPQQPVWRWTLSTDVHNETLAPYLLRSSSHPPITSHTGEQSRQGHWLLADLWAGLKPLAKAFPLCSSSGQSSTEHSCASWAPHQPSPRSPEVDAAAQKDLPVLLLPHPLCLCFLIASKCLRVQGTVYSTLCLSNKCYKGFEVFKLLPKKVNMGFSEKVGIKSPHSEF